MVAIPAQVASPSHWVLVENSASALIRYTGPWYLEKTRGEGSTASRRSAAEISANADMPVRWIDSNGSLSVDFAGYEGSLIGGMSFTPSTADSAFCTIDGVTVPLNATGAQKLNKGNAPLCHVTGLSDGPHVLTLNVTDIGSMSESDVNTNHLWVDGFSYATSRWNLAARQAPSSSPSVPSAAPTGTNNSTNTGNSDSGTSTKTAVRIGEIAGGIIGGALFVVFLRGVFFFVQRNDGTRTAVGRPASPTYESGWTLPKLGKSGGKGGDSKKGVDASGGEAKGAQKGTVVGTHAPDDVPLSPLNNDDSKVPPVTTVEHASGTPEYGSHAAAV